MTSLLEMLNHEQNLATKGYLSRPILNHIIHIRAVHFFVNLVAQFWT